MTWIAECRAARAEFKRNGKSYFKTSRGILRVTVEHFSNGPSPLYSEELIEVHPLVDVDQFEYDNEETP